jgi:hypothetical protein
MDRFGFTLAPMVSVAAIVSLGARLAVTRVPEVDA